MAFAQLLSAQYLIDRNIVDSNVDTKLLSTGIIMGQDLNIQTILGETLYQSLMNQQIAGIWNTQLYQVLVYDYIQPALMWWAMYHSSPFITFKLTNKTIVQQTSDHSTAATTDNLEYLRQIFRDNAEWYTQRIREQIANNTTAYPEYFTFMGVERIQPKRTVYFSGIYHGNRTQKRIIKPGYGDPGCCDSPNTQPV